jgi:branched-chain amino acid transport system permease protein
VIGGEGSLIGPLFGAALLTILPTIFQPLAVYKTMASGALLAGSALYMPQGLFGLVVRLLPASRPAPALPQERVA